MNKRLPQLRATCHYIQGPCDDSLMHLYNVMGVYYRTNTGRVSLTLRLPLTQSSSLSLEQHAPTHPILFALTGATGSHSLSPLRSHWSNMLPLTQSSSLSLEQQAPTHSILFALTGATGSHSLSHLRSNWSNRLPLTQSSSL